MGVDCGCDNRREIMFDKGNLGLPEAVFIGGMILLLIGAWKASTKG